MRLFIRRFLGENVSGLAADELWRKFQEAEVMRELEVGVMREAILKAFGGGK